MADSNVFELYRAVIGGADRFLDYLFYAGAVYGAGVVTRFALSALRGVRTYFVPFGRVSEEDLSVKYGKWAVITGGTTGIGLAYAHEFARRNVNVVLISKSYDDLVSIISELQTQYNVHAYGIFADFSLGLKVYQDVEEALKDLDIGILVNNVSVRYDHPQYFALIPHQRVWQIVNANVTAITVMTHMLLPRMLQRSRGAIINVCSISASTPPIPLTAEYTASMAYVDRFSQALHYENRHKGICVQTLLPCFVAQAGTPPSLFAPSAETYVRHALSTLGIRHRISGYWPHALQHWLCSLIPERLWVWFTQSFNKATRKRCLQAQAASGAPLFSRKVFLSRRPSPIQLGVAAAAGVGAGAGGTPSSPRRTGTRLESDSAESAFSYTTTPRRLHVNIRDSPSEVRRKISLEEITRSHSPNTPRAAGMPTPIRENSASPSPLSTPEAGQMFSPRFDHTSPSPPPPTVAPRRSSTVSTLDPQTARRMSGTYRRNKTSRVLVMPTVAMVSYSPEPGAQGQGNSQNSNTSGGNFQ